MDNKKEQQQKNHKQKSYGRIKIKKNIIQLPPEGEMKSGGYMPRREASRYIHISTAPHQPGGG